MNRHNTILSRGIEMIIINREAGTVAFEWCTNDVRRVISDRNIRFKGGTLTEAECFNVLSTAVKHHDLDEGIRNDVIEFWIFTIYRARIINGRDDRHGYYV
jgi:hypothetical protein